LDASASQRRQFLQSQAATPFLFVTRIGAALIFGPSDQQLEIPSRHHWSKLRSLKMTTAADTFLKSPAITRSGGTNAGTRRFINLEAPLAATVSAIAEPLSVRQADILDLIAQGRSNKEIARILSVAPETVKTHVKHIFIKLKVGKRAEAVSRAAQALSHIRQREGMIPGGLKVRDANGQSLAYVYPREKAELSAEGITDPEAWPLWQGPTIWWLGCSR
jgi:ATP/maltotriose-dependent transcriptional regulator MalT